MGKNNKTVNSALWAIKNPGKANDMEERFGVNVRNGAGWKSGSGESYEEYRESSDWHNKMTDAARNDYDLRRTLEAAAMSGKGKAKKILDKGFNNLEDVSKAMNFSEKAAKRHGQGGDFSRNSDYMGLTRSMVERDRRKMIEGLEIPDADDINAVKPDAGPSFDGEETDAMRKNREEVEAYEAGMGSEGTRIFGGDPASSAKGFSDEYKLNVARGLELSGKKTRGPESGLVPGEGF
jgi:hypothetical protein